MKSGQLQRAALWHCGSHSLPNWGQHWGSSACQISNRVHAQHQSFVDMMESHASQHRVPSVHHSRSIPRAVGLVGFCNWDRQGNKLLPLRFMTTICFARVLSTLSKTDPFTTRSDSDSFSHEDEQTGSCMKNVTIAKEQLNSQMFAVKIYMVAPTAGWNRAAAAGILGIWWCGSWTAVVFHRPEIPGEEEYSTSNSVSVSKILHLSSQQERQHRVSGRVLSHPPIPTHVWWPSDGFSYTVNNTSVCSPTSQWKLCQWTNKNSPSSMMQWDDVPSPVLERC